jgi:hypothetical protein
MGSVLEKTRFWKKEKTAGARRQTERVKTKGRGLSLKPLLRERRGAPTHELAALRLSTN